MSGEPSIPCSKSLGDDSCEVTTLPNYSMSTTGSRWFSQSRLVTSGR